MAASNQADISFAGKVFQATTQGAVAAVVAASLSAVTEPIVNKVLVERIPLSEALKSLDASSILGYFAVTVSTNFIKFPFFEVTNVLMSDVKDLSPTARGALTGAVFCTLTLPITNYRFRKSLKLPIELKLLYQAYLPTVLRDIIYGTVRTLVNDEIKRRHPTIMNTWTGKFFATAFAVLISCLVSAPANEMRAYTLQDPKKKKTVKDFFQPEKFIRSTSIGGAIMSFAMGTGAINTTSPRWCFGISCLDENKPNGCAPHYVCHSPAFGTEETRVVSLGVGMSGRNVRYASNQLYSLSYRCVNIRTSK
jgi:hypothetical protein